MIEAKPAIDLSRYAFKRELGDLILFGTWLMNDEQEDTEPCLVIVPRHRVRNFKPAVIALSAAFRYNDPIHTARAAATFAHNLGFEDMMSADKIANMILDHLGDLVTMPPDPTVAHVVGEAHIDMGDGSKRKIEVLDYEQDRG